MQRFVVPQFIDVEPKIIMGITPRQFILMLGGGAFIFLAIRFGTIGTTILTILGVAAIVIPFGFLKIQGAPFHEFLLNVVFSFKRPRLRVWAKNLSDIEVDLDDKKTPNISKAGSNDKKNISPSRLAELSLIVDTKGRYKGEK